MTDDYRYLVIQVDRGVPARRVDIVYRDLTKPGSYFDVLIWGVDSRFSADYVKGAWYVSTDYKSPNWRILKADPGIMPDAWTTIVPEGADAMDGFNIVGDKIYVNRLHDVKTETDVYALDGKPAGTIAYDSIGSATILSGRSTERYGYFSFESFIVPPTIYRVDTLTGKREVFAQPKVPFDSSQYELKQVFFPSKDGTRVPMFIAGKKGPEAGWNRAPADDRLRRIQPERAARSGSRSMPGGWSKAAGLRCPTCAAAANTARNGTSRRCFLVSRTCLTTFLPRRSTWSSTSTRRPSILPSWAARMAVC